MTAAVTVTDRSALAAALRHLKLSGMLDTLDARLAQARAGELGHLDFLQVLCQDEISRRESMSLARRIRRARFETPATLEGFDFGASPISRSTLWSVLVCAAVGTAGRVIKSVIMAGLWALT